MQCLLESRINLNYDARNSCMVFKEVFGEKSSEKFVVYELRSTN